MPRSGKPSKDEAARQLTTAVESVATAYHRLVLLVGNSGDGKTELLQQLAQKLEIPVVNVNLELSRRLLELPRKRRPRQVEPFVKELINAEKQESIILDNLEILFDTALQLDPLRLLKAVSRNRTIVASWNGMIEDDSLSYAEPDHAEYRSYRDVDVQMVAVGTQASS